MNKKQEQATHLENLLFKALEEESKWKGRLERSNYLDNYAATKLQEAEAARVFVEDQLHGVWDISSGVEVHRIWQHLKKRYPEMTNLEAARLVGRRLEEKKVRVLP